MQIPLNTFYLLRILYLEGEGKNDAECGCIGDFIFAALLSASASKLDSLTLEKRERVKQYRVTCALTKFRPPRLIANREFVLEEYLSLRQSVVLIPVESDLTDKAVSGDAESLAALHRELDEMLLPCFQLCDKRAKEVVPDDSAGGDGGLFRT
jgi:hypothetical protein